MRVPVGPRQACLAIVCGSLALLVPIGAGAAQLAYLGPVDEHGAGIGNVATVLSVGNHGVESGCVSWDGSGDITGPGAPACPAGIAGGDEKNGGSQTLTRTLSELGNPAPDTLLVIFNINEPGSDRAVRLDAMALRVLSPGGDVLLEAYLPSGLDLVGTDSGIGSAGWAFGLEGAADAAFASGDNRVGLAATISGADGGFETFYLATVPTGPGGGGGPADRPRGRLDRRRRVRAGDVHRHRAQHRQPSRQRTSPCNFCHRPAPPCSPLPPAPAAAPSAPS